MSTKTKMMSPVKMWAGVAIFAGIAAFGYMNSEPVQDYIANHFFNDGKGEMMEAQARETFKGVHHHVAMVAATAARVATK